MTKPRSPLLADANFLWLLGGGMLSMLGDQFTLLALPWLVLKMTGNTLIVGTVLAVISIPRALFILVGGALVDRTSSKHVLLLTKYVNALLLGLLSASVMFGVLGIEMVYVLALLIGLTSAFSFPAGTAIMPQVVPGQHLQAANSILMMIRQISMLLGPFLAGLLIVLFGDGSTGLGRQGGGLAFAFAVDCASFVISAWTLNKVRLLPEATAEKEAEHVWRSVKDGVLTMWRDHSLRAICLYFAAISFFIGGPIQVALPVLADRNLSEGAAGFGVLSASHGAGMLLGMMISGARPNLRFGSLGSTVLAIDFMAGAIFIPFGMIDALWQGIFLLLPLGALGGFIQVGIFSWMQRRVAPAMMGRAMSIFMFIFMGLAPMSAALAGWALGYVSPGTLFAASGAVMMAIVLLARMGGAVSRVGVEAAQ